MIYRSACLAAIISGVLAGHASGQAAHPDPVGTWHGTSLCQVRPSACHDETVVSRIARTGVRDSLVADGRRIVNDAEVSMGASHGAITDPGLKPANELPSKPMSSPNRGSVAMPTLVAAEPQLYVRDIAVSTEFYSRKLGFSVAFTHGEPAFYAQVFRDGARLNLRHVDEPALDPVRRDAEQLLAATITLEDAEPLFAEFQAAGVEFVQPLRTESWGARTFMVRDPDGNLLLFAGRGE